MVTTRAVLSRYDRAGGGLIAAGLAYTALFALVPLTLFLVGVIGLAINDPAEQARAVGSIANVLPPLKDLLGVVLSEAAGAAGALSIIGSVTLLWGASRFVVAFLDAIRRIFGATTRRSFLERNLVGIGAVAGLGVATVLGTVIAGLSSFLDAAAGVGGPVVGWVAGLGLAAAPAAISIASIALVYRFVPIIRPAWSSIRGPAVVVGIALVVLARAFVFLAPRLIGAAAAVGTVAAAFAALAWLNLSFQAILIGGAWVREGDPRWLAASRRGDVKDTDVSGR